MVPQPIGQNPQVQSLTTALKNICRDYPAGGTVLRELLQNADDAGATVVRFILDTKTHPTDELIHDHLKQYQGPALLVYNNSIFTDKDFESLSRIGDSLKINDGSTTGKFGRGFNSVYNWTDSPSIVSRNRLLILDPHFKWSGGGPVYDFVASCEDSAMQNHMAAFQNVMDHFDQPLEGTVIRIPLRTQAQVKHSEIVQRETTASEILNVFRSFSSEFGNNGLLFMRNVEELEFGSADGTPIRIEMLERAKLCSHKLKVNHAVKSSLSNRDFSFDHSFQAEIEYRSTEEVKRTAFLVHHSIQPNLIEDELKDWAHDQKLMPWVAVAAQLPIQSSEKMTGSLFTVLPLPISTMQPIHIHGLFSISPDRARLYQLGDRSIQDQIPARWNDRLLQRSVPVAWAKLLIYLTDLYPRQAAFDKWPQSTDDVRDPLSNATANLIGIIEKECLALWPTDVGYITAKNGLLEVGNEPEDLRDALREAKVPIVYIPQQLREKVEILFKGRILCPQTLCHFLKSERSQVSGWSEQTKHRVLEYLLSKPGFIEYDGLELFPFQDGKYRSIEDTTVFVHRDDFEKGLFSLEDFRNLDLDKLSAKAQRILRDGCENSTGHPSIRYRSASCLREYCMSTIFKNSSEDRDFMELDEESTTFVSKVWTWISMRRIDILDKAIRGLWLLPLSNGHHRKIEPRNSSSQIYYAPVGERGELMRKLDAKSSTKLFPLLDTRPTGSAPELMEILTKRPQVMPTVFIMDATSIVSFLQWLHQSPSLIYDGAEDERVSIARFVASCSPDSLTDSGRKTVVDALRSLPIFQKIAWKMKDGRMEHTLTWTNLESCTTSIGLLEGISPVPDISGVQFLIAELSSHSQQILQNFDLAPCLKPAQVIQHQIIPAWKDGQGRKWTSYCKRQMADLILGQFSTLPLEVQIGLQELPMVPVSQLDGKKTSRFALAADLIDPSVAELSALCFDGEEKFPATNFFRKFGVALKGCGLKSAVDEAVIENRVRYYSNTAHSLIDIRQRAERLLQSGCIWTFPINEQKVSALRQAVWLPVFDPCGTFSLKASKECRSDRDRLLVSSQLPILTIPISAEWEARLGWNQNLPDETILSQLSFGIQSNNRQIVDAVLTYISHRHLTAQLNDALVDLTCVLANNGMFILPSQAFRPSVKPSNRCDGLQPYLANVERKFWQEHQDLLIGLKVGDELDLSDLLNVQRSLEAKTVLEESDIAIAIEILNLASYFQRDALTRLKVIDEAGKFHLIQDISFNDLGSVTVKQKINLTHPDIQSKTIRQLGISSLRERLLKGMLEIEDDDDEDEYDQRENIVTRIADTLDRYPVESTFREYLANADDAKGASRIDWLLDKNSYHCDTLVTPELKSFQGPSLLVHNDGVFSDDDFEGFKNVGEGSKSQSRETIGQFGRGSQTMYHWTDVPMILSGNFMIILDPRREVLVRSKITGKHKPGLRLKLSKLREACSDQLAPFEGLWGYTKDLDYYPGTIFRFPLRTKETRSALRVYQNNITYDDALPLMVTYFSEARISLLFLRQIQSISFSSSAIPNSQWSITRQASLDDDEKSFSQYVICDLLKVSSSGITITGKDRWWVAIEDLRPAAENHPESSRRAMKNVECGLAALISTKSDDLNLIVPLTITQSRMFNTLPLPIASDLPVHIHATFQLSGDRQSIAVDEYGIQSYGSKWNRYLLQDALPKLYLQFLDDIGPIVRQRVFEFWPEEEPPKRSCADLLCTSFWKGLPKCSRRLFPKAQLHLELRNRRAAELFDINQAVFDFLPKHQSEALAPLLISLEDNLVRHIPKGVAKHLKQLQPQVKSITGSRLRQLLKSDRSRSQLEKEMAKIPLIFEVLSTDVDLAGLDGCHLLPLADGSLTKLKYVEVNDTQTPKYYVASAKELKLFDFATKHLVSPSTGTTLKPVLDSGKFNLTRLRLCHMKIILKLRPIISKPDAETDRWLTEFWTYWNGHSESSLSSLEIGHLGANIFRAICNGTDIYTMPAAFQQLAAVVEPSIIEHQQLCAQIPGLHRFNTKFMPRTLTDNESSFDNENSFYRLIRALRILSGSSGVKTFVGTHLNPANVKTLRNLVVSHVSDPNQNSKPERFPGLRSVLKSTPLWPSFHDPSSDRLISATDLLMAGNSQILVPWMKERRRFIDPEFLKNSKNESCLFNLGVEKLSTKLLLNNYVLPLPSVSIDEFWRQFQTLISAIAIFSLLLDPSDTLWATLKQSKLAADGGRTLWKACELYDHEDQIFISAFRHQRETKFLHAVLKEHRLFWLKVGLRYRKDDVIGSEDYVQCLQVLGLRLSVENQHMDPYLEQDSRIVLSILTSPSSAIQRFDKSAWLTISRENVFRSRTALSSESDYRRDTMSSVAANKRLLCLSEVISPEYIGICWSQTPFPIHHPTKEALGKIHGNGQPRIEMVLRHLDQMKDVAQHLKRFQVRDFLTDLHLTYEYLQDHSHESMVGFKRDSAIWLNINLVDHNTVQLDDIKSCWNSLDELVLSISCDAGGMKAVKPGLRPYEKLLRNLGCTSLIYPVVKAPELHSKRSIPKSLQQLRRQEKLIDIKYSTEGKILHAHRVVLAAMSEKCALQFSGRWKVDDIIEYDKKIDPEAFLSYHTLSTMINYAYENEINWEEMEVVASDDAHSKAMKLDLLLDLHKGADYWLIPALASQVQAKIMNVGWEFINLENVLKIRKRAEEVRAKEVEQMCTRLIERNPGTVLKAHGRLL